MCISLKNQSAEIMGFSRLSTVIAGLNSLYRLFSTMKHKDDCLRNLETRCIKLEKKKLVKWFIANMFFLEVKTGRALTVCLTYTVLYLQNVYLLALCCQNKFTTNEIRVAKFVSVPNRLFILYGSVIAFRQRTLNIHSRNTFIPRFMKGFDGEMK